MCGVAGITAVSLLNISKPLTDSGIFGDHGPVADALYIPLEFGLKFLAKRQIPLKKGQTGGVTFTQCTVLFL